MIKEYYREICAGEQVRKNLIALRGELKEEKGKREFACLLGGDFSQLCRLLEDEDPKIRKNAALILGTMESEDMLPVLFDAYQKEETLFVRADFLRAISGLDYRPVLGQLEQRLRELCAQEPDSENRKHEAEEMRVLQAMVMRCGERQQHRFTGLREPVDLILIANRCQREVTAKQVQSGKITMLAGGLRVQGTCVEDVRHIRTWQEMLFPLELREVSAEDPYQVGEALAQPVLSLADRLHQGGGAYRFRIEYKGKTAPERKGVMLRRIADAAERASGGRLANNVSDYELELRLLERKDGMLVPMVRFYTLRDGRFGYRRETVASSISPVNAALTAELARPWLKEGAQVLDPFCGVGTMLIERDRAVKAGIMYGVDLFGEAIEKARRNTERAGCSVYYIKKDFFTFEHGYRFDEIVSDLPQVTQNHSAQQISGLYRDFFACAGRYLKPEALLALYTTEPGFVVEALRGRREYRIAQRHTVNEKNGTEIFIIQRHGEYV